MKLKINQEDLVLGLQKVQNIVSPKATLPILSNVLLSTVGKNTLKLYATDLDIGICCEIPVDIVEEGAITLPAKRFSDIIRELPNDQIAIYAKKNFQVDIEGTNCRFKLNGLPKEEYPKFPEFKDKQQVSFLQKDLKEMLRMTSFSVSNEESRYVLNGVLFEIHGNLLKLVATDGRRLAKYEKKLEEKINEDIQVIIPTKAISEVMRNLKDEGDVKITVGFNQILFDINGVLITTRIIEGDFPNYNQVIPKEIKEKIQLNTKEFLSAIRRANLLATPDFQAIKIEVFQNKLVISKSTPDVGESREELQINYSGKEMIVGFNPQFLIDFLKNLSDEAIDLELIGVDKPAVVRMKNYLYLALPMRI